MQGKSNQQIHQDDALNPRKLQNKISETPNATKTYKLPGYEKSSIVPRPPVQYQKSIQLQHNLMPLKTEDPSLESRVSVPIMNSPQRSQLLNSVLGGPPPPKNLGDNKAKNNFQKTSYNFSQKEERNSEQKGSILNTNRNVRIRPFVVGQQKMIFEKQRTRNNQIKTFENEPTPQTPQLPQAASNQQVYQNFVPRIEQQQSQPLFSESVTITMPQIAETQRGQSQNRVAVKMGDIENMLVMMAGHKKFPLKKSFPIQNRVELKQPEYQNFKEFIATNKEAAREDRSTIDTVFKEAEHQDYTAEQDWMKLAVEAQFTKRSGNIYVIEDQAQTKISQKQSEQEILFTRRTEKEIQSPAITLKQNVNLLQPMQLQHKTHKSPLNKQQLIKSIDTFTNSKGLKVVKTEVVPPLDNYLQFKARQFQDIQRNQQGNERLLVFGGKINEQKEQKLVIPESPMQFFQKQEKRIDAPINPQYLKYLVDRITSQLNLTNDQIDFAQLQAYIAMRLTQNRINPAPQKAKEPHKYQGLSGVMIDGRQIHNPNSVYPHNRTESFQKEIELLSPIQCNGINPQILYPRHNTHFSRQRQRELLQMPPKSSNSQPPLTSFQASSQSVVEASSTPSNGSNTQMNVVKREPVDQSFKQKLQSFSSGTNREKAKEKKKVKNDRRIPQYHDTKQVDDLHSEHRINVAIKRINQIVKLIFKNTKDSQAITSGSGGNVIIPVNRSTTEDQRFQELSKVIKLMNILIPKKFDSKSNMREFFYSREFILNLKIKMNEQFHQAVLYSNNMPKLHEEVAENAQAAGNQTQRPAQPLISRANKFWVGLGNNSAVVKSVLKQRYWWQKGASESLDEVDFVWTAWKKEKHINRLKELNNLHHEQSEEGHLMKLYNKLEQNKQLTNKKGMFVNMRTYYDAIGEDPFKVLPLTFHTKKGLKDPEFVKFTNYYYQLEQKIQHLEHKQKQAIEQLRARYRKNQNTHQDDDPEDDADLAKQIEDLKCQMRVPKNTWIIKPGENTNRGNGIDVCKSLQEIKQIVGRATRGDRTAIIQKYIDYPLLVHKRKFDFRCYGLMTSINGSLKGYFFEDGYVRTSCKEFSHEDVGDKFVHLTNDAIQVHADDYGKYESGNKLSFSDFSRTISVQNPDVDFDMYRDILPQMRKLVADTYRCSVTKIDPDRLQNSFELFGYDFMLDENWRLYLIEVNTNPCFDCNCSLLQRIIPDLLDNCFRIVLDPLFPSPDLSQNRKFQLNELPQEIKFTLCFDEDLEGEFLRNVLSKMIAEEEIESDQEQELQEDDEALLNKSTNEED